MHCDLEYANNHEKEHSKQILVLKITGSENKRVAKGQDNLKQVNERGKFLKKKYISGHFVKVMESTQLPTIQ